MTTIVTDVRYRMSLALIRDLADEGIRVLAVERDDRRDSPLGFFSSRTAKAHLLSGTHYMEDLTQLCRRTADEEGERPALLPIGAQTLSMLSRPEVRQEISAFCGLHLADSGQLTLLNDKSRVAELARSLDIPIPQAYVPAPEESAEAFAVRVRLPAVVKPLCGEALGLHARDRYAICRSREELLHWISHFSRLEGASPVVQEYLPGAGLGCSVLADRGHVVSLLSHRRIREYPISGGPSSCCRSVHAPELAAYAAGMAAALEFSGLMMLEFKLDGQGCPRLLEVNPRVWGSFPLTRATGSPIGRNWFRLAWNQGNRDRPPLALEPDHFEERTMQFIPSDLLAGAGYLRRRETGDILRGLGAAGCLFNPSVREGLWSWRDPKPALAYYRSLVGRRRGR